MTVQTQPLFTRVVTLHTYADSAEEAAAKFEASVMDPAIGWVGDEPIDMQGYVSDRDVLTWRDQARIDIGAVA